MPRERQARLELLEIQALREQLGPQDLPERRDQLEPPEQQVTLERQVRPELRGPPDLLVLLEPQELRVLQGQRERPGLVAQQGRLVTQERLGL